MAKKVKTELMPDNDRPSNQPKTHAPKSRILSKLRRRKIIEACLDGKDLKEVAISTGLSPKSAASQARQILSEPNVKSSFVSILEEQGLSDEFLAKKAKDLLEAETHHYFSKDGVVVDERTSPAHETQRKTLELVGKFKSHLKDKQDSDTSSALMQVVINALNINAQLPNDTE